MGKKKKDKKGKGAEKTAQKTERKAERKVKKIMKDKGEDDIEALIAEFQEKDKKLAAVIEEKCPPPTPRCNMSLSPHPEKDELILFGGEYFNGSKTFLYNDLLFFNLKTQEWTKLTAPNAPPPRCAHQAVALKQGGGQLWLFGGEFASPSLSQFYHYKDLWCFHLKEKRWEKINAPGAPTSRSGHRMVVCKRQLLVFGGFHDNVGDYKYYNDLHAFNLDTFTWSKLAVSGQPPAARSACQMGVLHDQRHIVVYGGYSKERSKKDVDSGKVHTDMFVLTPEGKNKDDPSPEKWKWSVLKQSGVKPSPRCSFSMVTTPGNRAIVFGGVFDKEEDEEHMEGVFYNEMYSLDLESGKWHEVILRGKKEDKERKRRRKKKDQEGDGEGAEEAMEEGDEDQADDVEEGIEQMKVDDGAQQTTYDDGIFTVTVGASGGGEAGTSSGAMGQGGDPSKAVFMPCPRTNAALAVKHGDLYVYGGMYEDGDKQVTLADMYKLDLHRLDAFTTLIEDDISKKEWVESESDDDSDDEDEEGGAAGGDDMSGDSDEDSDMEDEAAPDARHGESLNDFFGRTRDYWLEAADTRAERAGIELLGKALKKEAFAMAEEHFKASGM